MAMKSITSADGKTWTAPDGAGNPLFHGPQLTVFRGELWGAWVCTQAGYENRVYVYKYANGKMPAWSGNVNTPENYKGIGRVSTTATDDKYFMAYRGASSGKVWVANTYSPGTTAAWAKLLNPGNPPSPFAYSPTLYAFQGSLILLGVTADNQIYWEIMATDGTIEKPWEAIPQLKTVEAPALCAYRGSLYMVFTAENRKEFWFTSLSSKAGSWSAPAAFQYSSPASSPSLAVHTDDKLYLAFQGNSNGLCYFTYDGSSWGGPQNIRTTGKATGALGIASFGGSLYITYGQVSASVASTNTAWMKGEGVLITNPRDEDSDAESIDSIYDEKYGSRQTTNDPAGGQVVRPRSKWWNRLLCF